MQLVRRVVLFLPLFLCAVALGQQQTASLTGQVKDSSGAAVPGAQVVVTDPARGFKVTAVSNGNGDYTVPELDPADDYVITVSKPGFKETVQRNVILQVAQAAKIDLVVSVGEVSETVEVTAAPPQLDTQSSSLGQVITGETVQDLPLNGRSTFRLIALTPGVTFSQSAYGQFGDVPVNSTWDTNFTINGGRAQSNEILIDGVPSSAGFFDQITTLPIVDETQEFKVQSNDLPATYGRFTGGVINVTTKGGTNQFHGDIFEFARNSFFDANNWFYKAGGKPNQAFSMNQFGGTIGGPVIIPKLYNGKDHTFIFFAYQGTRRTQGNSAILTVPTVAERGGDFSAVKPIYNPFTSNLNTTGGQSIRSRFNYNNTNDVIPPSLIDPVAAAMINYYPLPNYGAAGSFANNFLSTAPLNVSQNIFSGRIDQNVTQKYHLAGRYEYSNTDLTQPNTYGNIATTGTGAVGTTNFTNQSFAFTNIYQFNPKFLMNFNYGYARWYQSRQTLSYGFNNATLGFPSSFVSQITIPMFPGVTIGGYSGFAGQSFLNNGNDTHALLVNGTLLLGKQSLTFGVDGRVYRINFFNVGNSAGQFSFALNQTENYTETISGTGTKTISQNTATGDGFASFLLGAGSSGSFPIGSGVEMQSFYGGAFVQDDIRLTQNLTLNLGVRYDGQSPYDDRHNELNYFDPNVASPLRNTAFPNLTGGLVFANTNGVGRTVYNTQMTNVAPRVGFSYNPLSGTVIRGGYGIAYGPLEISNNAVGFSPSLGYQSSTSWNTSNDGGYTPANLLRNPYPQGVVKPTGSMVGAGTQAGQTLTVLDHNPKQPYAMQYNLDLQQQFPHELLLDVGYSGSKGEHLTSTFDFDTLDPRYLSLGASLAAPAVSNPFYGQIAVGTLANTTVAQRQLLLPFPQFTSVQDINDPYGYSNYNSLQLKVVKRLQRGFQFLGSYTWSKLISNVNAQEAPIGTTDNTGVQNYYNLAGEKAVSELDQPQNFVFNASYELPFGRGQRFGANVGPGLNKLIGGWKFSGIWTEQSGFPLTFSAPGVGAGTRPNPVPGVSPFIQGKRSNQSITGITTTNACTANSTCGWFNVGAFTTPAPYTFGTIERTYTAIRGPGVQNVDATLQKDIRFRDAMRAELRVEMFNVTNTPHFAQPNTIVGNASFGKITALIPSPPQRQFQFAGKFYF